VRHEPDVCLLDPYHFEAQDSMQVIGAVCRSCPDTAVVVIADPSDGMSQAQARELGIAGLLGTNRSVS